MKPDDRTNRMQATQRLQFALRNGPLAIVASACFFAIYVQRRIGLSLHDEGFLWYGAQRLLQGELPLRDFQAYDPGRYYWAAAWMAVFGDDSILMLRTADAVLAGITVGLATWAVTFHTRRTSVETSLAVGAIFSLWMQPPFKVADSFATILMLCALSRLIERSTLDRYFQLGVCLGIAATIGINHALYGLIASGLAFAYIQGRPAPLRALGAGTVGGVIGYSPVLVLDAFAPGFAGAFIDSIAQILEAGETNLSKPFPDLLAVLRGPLHGHLSGAAESLLATLLFSVPILWIWAVSSLRFPRVRTAIGPVLPAGLILALPYAHYVTSRADVTHAAISVLPVLAVGLASAIHLAPSVPRWLLIASIFGVSLILTAREQPVYPLLKGDAMEPVAVDGTILLVRPVDASEIRAARSVAAMAGSATFLAAPYFPGAYALARRRSPTWEIYMLFPASASRQRAEIARLRGANIRHALISTDRVDDRSDLGLAHTHGLLLAELNQRLKYSINIPGNSNMMIKTNALP